MNSSEFFIQEYPVISFDLFIYAKITQCKIGLFCYVAKSLNFRAKLIFKKDQFSVGIDFSMVLIKTEIGLFDQKQAETIFYTTSVYRV